MDPNDFVDAVAKQATTEKPTPSRLEASNEKSDAVLKDQGRLLGVVSILVFFCGYSAIHGKMFMEGSRVGAIGYWAIGLALAIVGLTRRRAPVLCTLGLLLNLVLGIFFLLGSYVSH